MVLVTGLAVVVGAFVAGVVVTGAALVVVTGLAVVTVALVVVGVALLVVERAVVGVGVGVLAGLVAAGAPVHTGTTTGAVASGCAAGATAPPEVSAGAPARVVVEPATTTTTFWISCTCDPGTTFAGSSPVRPRAPVPPMAAKAKRSPVTPSST